MPLTATVARGAAALGWKASEQPARSASARIDLAIVDLDEDGRAQLVGSTWISSSRLLELFVADINCNLAFLIITSRARRKRTGKGCPVVFGCEATRESHQVPYAIDQVGSAALMEWERAPLVPPSQEKRERRRLEVFLVGAALSCGALLACVRYAAPAARPLAALAAQTTKVDGAQRCAAVAVALAGDASCGDCDGATAAFDMSRYPAAAAACGAAPSAACLWEDVVWACI